MGLQLKDKQSKFLLNNKNEAYKTNPLINSEAFKKFVKNNLSGLFGTLNYVLS